MEKSKEILSRCFNSSSTLWSHYLESEEETRIMYYPSARDDLRPFVFSKREALEFIGEAFDAKSYFEPNLFIFSDYWGGSENNRFMDSKVLYSDLNTHISIRDFCELKPNPANFKFHFNPNYVDFPTNNAFGRALFFTVDVHSHRFGNSYGHYTTNAIYFFYENVNLIDQLFLRHRLPVSHLCWKRDGSSLGGGRVNHRFLLPVSLLLDTEFYFMDKHGSAEGELTLKKISYREEVANIDRFPPEIAKYLDQDFSLRLKYIQRQTWGCDKVSVYQKTTLL